MFGGFASFIQPSAPDPPPKSVPPPTPIDLPDWSILLSGGVESTRQRSLVRHLQSLFRPADLQDDTFAALGVHVHTNVPAEDLIPDASYLPPASEWDDMTIDEARKRDSTFQKPLSNGSLSPEARTYLDRHNELSIDNQSAFRTVRRIKAVPGQKVVRLGNSYEFFRQLEQMAGFWDDTSLPPYVPTNAEVECKEHPEAPGPDSRPLDGGLEQTQVSRSVTASTAVPETRLQSTENKPAVPERVTYRTSPGESMPPPVRHNLIAAFVKLVSYDFGCNVNTPRVEPRLHLQEPKDPSNSQHEGLATYFASGCVFVFRIPSARDAARTGILEGPVAAVSTRNNTNFSSPTDKNMDLARELVAALITAQHRAREGHSEKRFGQGKWWATEKRWGGGEGGPIGREIEGQADLVGDKDAPPPSAVSAKESAGPSPTTSPDNTQKKCPPNLMMPSEISMSSGLAMRGPPLAKKARKGLSMYDAYRMVRLPSSNWDSKMRYEAIGKQTGADYDDIFVISSLFHHISILRVRVPERLLDVLAGEAEDEQQQERSWEKLEVWRTRWFDLFLIGDRLEALRTLWGSLAWMMRKTEKDMEGDDGKREGVEVKGVDEES